MDRVSRRRLLLGLAAGAAGLAVFEATSADRVRLTRHDIRLPRWDADGFTVAVIGDLHANYRRDVERARRAIRIALEARPDLIAVVGDFVNVRHPRTDAYLRKALEELGDATCPVLAILGNHDYWIPDHPALLAELRRQPFRLLRNDRVDFSGITVLGVDDPMLGYDQYYPLRLSAPSRSTLILMHEPDYVFRVPRSLASLTLSGHSHGGQVCLPGGYPLSLPPGARRYVAGLYPDAPTPLFVTKGVGMTRAPFRLFCPPEVALLTLRGAG
jgi:predicted MPP superfamily phosphohydrolase